MKKHSLGSLAMILMLMLACLSLAVPVAIWDFRWLALPAGVLLVAVVVLALWQTMCAAMPSTAARRSIPLRVFPYRRS